MTTLSDLSASIAERMRAAAPTVVAIRLDARRHLTGTLWKSDTIVASAQSLPARETYDVVLPGGTRVEAKPAGRDPGTNIAVLKLNDALSPEPANAWGEPHLGALALALGADGEGGATARLGLVRLAGPEWQSMSGSRIDRRILLDMRLNRAEEGGPALDANGARLGITTFGPRRQVLVIPSATIERVVPALVKEGRVARGWLGVALQPVEVPESFRESADQKTGLMAMKVAADGPCARAGMLPGDIVLSIDGEPAWPIRRTRAWLGADSIGRQMTLKLVRGGAVLSLDATITARPAE